MVGFGHWQTFPELPPRQRDAHLKRRTQAELEALDDELAPKPSNALHTVHQGTIPGRPLPNLSTPCGAGTWARTLGHGLGVVYLDPALRHQRRDTRRDAPAWFTSRGVHRSHWTAIRPAGRPVLKPRVLPTLFDVCLQSHGWRGPKLKAPSPYLGSLNCRAS